jgi:hypothetical protein
MSGSGFPVPPSLIALFPLLLELIERILEQIGLAGDALVERLLDKDTRQVWKSIPEGQRPGILEMMKEYLYLLTPGRLIGRQTGRSPGPLAC